jgi:hypothetical protein
VIEIDEYIGRPELLLQFFASDYLAGTREEHGQYLEGLPL